MWTTGWIGVFAATTSTTAAPLPVLMLDEVVVTASRIEQAESDAVTTTEVIREAEITRVGARDAAEALEAKDGIRVVRSFQGATVQMRGFGADDVLVLVDGQRQVGAVGGSIDLRRFPVEQIERIEVVKGASSALYGADALAGVVNIITKRPSETWTGHARMTAGSFRAVDLAGDVSGRVGDLGLRIAAGLHRADPYDLSPETPGTSASGTSGQNATASFRYDLGTDAVLKSRIDWFRRALDAVDATGPAVFDRRNRQQQLSATLEPSFGAGPGRLRIALHGAYFVDRFLMDQRNGIALDELQETRESLGRLESQYDFAIGVDHFVSVGTEALYQQVETPRLEPGVGERGRLAAYVQDEWALFDEALVVVPGARADVDTQFGAFVSPKLAAKWDPHHSITIRTSVGRGFKAPTFREQLLRFENASVGYLVLGNPDLRPERSWSADLAVDVRLDTWVGVRVSGFYNEVTDLVTPVSNGRANPGAPEVFRYDNIETATLRGGEANVWVAPIDQLRLEAGYSWLDAIDRDAGRTLEGRARHQASFAMVTRFGAGPEASLRGSVVGPAPYYVDDGQGPQTLRTSPYAVVDLRVAQRLANDHLTISAGINNALDAGDARFVPIPPRAVYAAVDARY